jgi:hypothetical protein
VATVAVEYPAVLRTDASAQSASILPIHYFPLELAYPDPDITVKRVHVPKRAYAQIASIPVDPAYPLGPVPTFNLSTQTRAIMESMTPVRGDAVDTQVDKETADFWESLGMDMSDMRGDTVIIKKGKKKSEIDVSKSVENIQVEIDGVLYDLKGDVLYDEDDRVGSLNPKYKVYENKYSDYKQLEFDAIIWDSEEDEEKFLERKAEEEEYQAEREADFEKEKKAIERKEKKASKKKSKATVVSKSTVVSKIQKDMFAPALDMLLKTPDGSAWARDNVIVMAKLIDMLARGWDGEPTFYTGWEFRPSETFPVHHLGEMARLRDDMLKSNNGLTDCFYELLRQGDVNWDIGYSGGIGQKKSVKVYWKSGKSKKVIAEQKSHLKYLNDTIDWSDILERAKAVDLEKKAEAESQREVAKVNKELLGVEIIRGLFLDRPDLADPFLAGLTPAKIHKAMKASDMRVSGVNDMKARGSLNMLGRLYQVFRISHPEEKYKQRYRNMLTALRTDITGDAPPDEEVLFEPAPEDDGVMLK